MSYKRPRAALESESDAPLQHAPFAVYGTPLPAYDSAARDDGSYVPMWKQEVTDERGRKRLHGAFTGGWSAGYFNTVGSKEGWTPSTFVSSRSNRNKDRTDGKHREQRVEDFMDDEDLAEHAESQKLATQDSFAGLMRSANDAGPRGMFSELFRTTGETKGVQLLQRMGWRRGHGIGPKVRRRADGDRRGEMHLFAPENSRMIGFLRKVDRKGLGFAGERKLDAPSGPSDLGRDGKDSSDDEAEDDARILRANRSKVLIKPRPLRKSGMGVGVLNDDGSDDDDPYSIGPRISYNRVIGGKNKKKKPGIAMTNTKSAVVNLTPTLKKPTQQSTQPSGFRKCHDGRLPLDGFVLSISPIIISQQLLYEPPTVPDSWTPANRPARDNPEYQSTADAAKASKMDPKARAALLGEEQLRGKSVFDFISPEARSRLAQASGKTNLPPALNEGAPAGFETSEADQRRTLWDLVPHLSSETASAALRRGESGWMPYSEDPDKRARYKYFLELSAGLQSHLPERPKTISKDEWAKELHEFAEAAEIFKPVSGLMASRFTTGSNAPALASDAPDPSQPHRSSPDALHDTNPAIKAAKLGMHGPLTRSRLPFFPTRLLCKRFGVKPPTNVGVDTTDGPEAEHAGNATHHLDIVSQASLDRMMRESNFRAPSSGSAGVEGGPDDMRASVAGARAADVQELPVRTQAAPVDVETNSALEAQKAGQAVFKAIFGSDDEDD